jgi:hypothetical protein
MEVMCVMVVVLVVAMMVEARRRIGGRALLRQM